MGKKPLKLSEIARSRTRNAKGLECPDCGCRDLPIKTGTYADGGARRVRVCRYCGYEIETLEYANRR